MTNGQYRFLDPWTQLLPEDFPCVLAVAGSGGKTTLLHRLVDHYRDRGQSLLWTQTVAHPPPGGLPAAAGSAATSGSAVFAAGPDDGEGRCAGLSAAEIEDLRASHRPDVTVVESHAPTGTPLRADRVPAIWPSDARVVFLVAQVGALGRPYGPLTVAGVPDVQRRRGEEPRRVTVADLLATFEGESGLLAQVPEGGFPVPFLTGFGSYRDMDGMFELASALWRHPRVKVVCFAELLGDERRDEADLRVGVGSDLRERERVYALYSAELDGEESP